MTPTRRRAGPEPQSPMRRPRVAAATLRCAPRNQTAPLRNACVAWSLDDLGCVPSGGGRGRWQHVAHPATLACVAALHAAARELRTGWPLGASLARRALQTALVSTWALVPARVRGHALATGSGHGARRRRRPLDNRSRPAVTARRADRPIARAEASGCATPTTPTTPRPRRHPADHWAARRAPGPVRPRRRTRPATPGSFRSASAALSPTAAHVVPGDNLWRIARPNWRAETGEAQPTTRDRALLAAGHSAQPGTSCDRVIRA